MLNTCLPCYLIINKKQMSKTDLQIKVYNCFIENHSLKQSKCSPAAEWQTNNGIGIQWNATQKLKDSDYWYAQQCGWI